MTKQTVVKTIDPVFQDQVKAYLDRCNQVVEDGTADSLVEKGHLGLLWHKAVPDLPRPMSCPDLELVPVTEKEHPVGFAFFCHRLGCICTPMRQDMPGEYPDACPEHTLEDLRYGTPEEETHETDYE